MLIAQSFQNNGLTHSCTLMPMCEDLLNHCNLTLHDVELLAVATGPGSFTGLRIGVATAKGLAWAENKPCAGVSTLEAMAWTVAHMGGELCPVMDARRGQVYHARFLAEKGVPVRLTPDRARSLSDLAEELKKDGKLQIIVGDGALLCYTYLQDLGYPVCLSPPHLRFQSAWGVARGALEQARKGNLCHAQELRAQYHRLSQAERERLERG